MLSSRVATLLAWCAENQVQIDSALQVVDSQQRQPAAVSQRYQATSATTSDDTSREHSLSVYSREELIECYRTLVYIPKTAVLSVKSCFFSQRISSVPYGHGAHLALALALYGELLLGPQSRWFGYLQSLSRETVDIAAFWGVNDAIETRTCTCSARGCLSENDTSSAVDKQRQTTPSKCPWCIWLQDNRDAREWLEVTEVDGERLGLLEEIRQYYHNVVEPTFRAASTNPRLPYGPLSHSKSDTPTVSTPDTNPRVFGITFPGFCHAYSLVSTRAFWVDAFHGLAMVPIADAFNHTNDNHVQMESDCDVCVDCGSLAECEHDRENPSTAVPASRVLNVHLLSHDGIPTSSDIDCLEMRTVRPVPPFSEVFNTYGSLSNAVLLSRYGFMLPENEHDTVRMVSDPLSTMRSLIKYVKLERLPVGEEGHAVTGTSGFGRFAIRNTCREQQPYGQGMLDNEATSSLSAPDNAWEITILNRMHHVFTYVAGTWRSDAAWDEQEDGMIFNPQPSLIQDGSTRSAQDLVINADGKLSHTLWLLCIVVALFAAQSQLPGAPFGDLIERARNGPEGIASLTELKARLINVQRYVGRLCRIHDGDSVDGDVEGGGNPGSTSPPFPHLALTSPELDYDTEPEDSAQPAAVVQVQVRPAVTTPRGTSTSITDLDFDDPQRSPVEPGRNQCGVGPRNPEISTRFSPIPDALSQSCPVSCHPILPATEQSYPDAPWFSLDHTTGHRAQQRDHSSSAEGERPPKRARNNSVSVVTNRVDRLGRTSPEPTRRQGRHRNMLGAPGEDDTQPTADEDTTRLLARLLARAVVGLCRDRYRPPTLRKEQRGVGMAAAELGDLLDLGGAAAKILTVLMAAATRSQRPAST